MASETLFGPLGIDPTQVFRMRGESRPRDAAEAYGRIIETEVPLERGRPRLDFVFLGLGPDGHTASLFPGTRALQEKDGFAAANWIPKMREWRLTVTFPVLNSARRIVFLAAGQEKADAATTILERRAGWRALPASQVRPRRGTVLWLLDEEAGGRL
jgi:6-phosphogluconolactonase